MSEDQTAYRPAEAVTDELDWDIEVRGGEVWEVRRWKCTKCGSRDFVDHPVVYWPLRVDCAKCGRINGSQSHERCLGSEEAVFSKWADKMAERDFGER